MRKVFDEYGVCHDDAVNDVADTCEKMIHALCRELIADGIPIHELRAVGHWIEGAINCGVSCTIILAGIDKRKKEKQDDPIL